MVAVAPLSLPTKEAWIAQQIADLTPEERARYDASDFFRGFVETALEAEWEHPEMGDPSENARSFADGFVAFILKNHPPETAARIAAQRVELYGADFEREGLAIQDGSHPVQLLRC